MQTDELEQRLGERLRSLRIQRDLTQAELAEAANVLARRPQEARAGHGVHDDHTRQRAARPRPGALARCTGADALPSSTHSTSSRPATGRAAQVLRRPQGAPSKVEHPMTYQPTDVIEVLAWGRPRRRGGPRPGTGWYAFAYAPEWVDGGFELAPLHMPLRPSLTSSPTCRRTTFYGLAAIARRRPARRVRQRAGQRMDGRAGHPRGTHHAARPPRLRRRPGHGRARVPAAGPGARQPTRRRRCSWPTWCSRRVCTVRGEFAGDETAHAALQQLIQVGTSAGGARAKAVVAFNPTTYQVRSAYGDPRRGIRAVADQTRRRERHGHGRARRPARRQRALRPHRVRLQPDGPGGRHRHDRRAGCSPKGPRRHFMTRRFDRGPGGRRHHVISLCALAHLDYNMIGDPQLRPVPADGCRARPRARRRSAQAFRRMVFNVMAVNRDDHTKNFAFLRRRSDGAGAGL